MLVVLKYEIYNLDRYDSACRMPKRGDLPDRIALFRDGQEREYVGYDNKEERDDAWAKLVDIINDWYT